MALGPVLLAESLDLHFLRILLILQILPILLQILLLLLHFAHSADFAGSAHSADSLLIRLTLSIHFCSFGVHFGFLWG